MTRIDVNMKPRKWHSPRPPHEGRKVNNQMFYNSRAWRALAAKYRSHNPTCALCEQSGMVVAAQCVDHVRPINQGGGRMDWNNLQALCNACHAVKSGREAH